MPMRVTGMMSGLDTETIIQELVAAKQTKVDKLKKEQTRLEWKQDVWKELNSKIYKLYTGTLDNLVYQSSYMKKVTNSSNSNLVSISTKENAMDSVQELTIDKLAKAGYLTSGMITNVNGGRVTSGSRLVDSLGVEAGSEIKITVGGKEVNITVDENMTISNFMDKLQSAGVKANFDAANQRIFIGATGTGKAKDFTITAADAQGEDALKKLGLAAYSDSEKNAYVQYLEDMKVAGAKDAEIQNRLNELLASYTAERDNLVAKQADLENKYNVNGVDITDDDAREARIASLEDEVVKAKADLDAENSPLTDADKEVLAKKIAKMEEEISGLNEYGMNKDRLAVLNSEDYLKADGTAGEKIQKEAESDIEGKINKATVMLANWDNLAAVKTDGQDAEITLNGAKFTSDKNTFEVNGLTITCKGETNGEKITLTTENDVSGIYDMIKNFIKEYSALVNEMDKLYNAESAKGYEPLTDEEKDSMSEKEVEKWEQKIKDSILRRDSTLSTVSTAMKQIMMSGFSVNGKTMYLSDFGIETLGYFNAADNEKNAYHINGDEDEDLLKNKDNTLMDMIKTDPNAVVSFFTQLSQSLHGKMKELMGRTDYSSINTVYDDKKMKEDYDGYKSKISDAEKKLQAYEDKWYKKFSAMETALAKMQSNANAVTSLLGGS